ncbi:DUF748 domain-containing protein [Pelagicoccus sp. SDUM812002]|uniref:DUF748 domain-containing protein n=1 Tax=Pelagicoccus sp. SDUM812002 TaxID=3041266 RepID=UPI00280E73FB|nr:DUF748 domain-containing protein [Pelagicoccus sp. SDUM812002]MDQ8187737.1 DUF748 domain-containing protein [Pelagicoccus sp. SDUM812002]
MTIHKNWGSLSRKARFGWICLAVFAILLTLRAAAPTLVERHVNGVLDNLDGYSGSIDDVDLSLFRGAYRIEGLVLDKDEGGAKIPFLEVPGLDLSIEWKALLDGGLVGELILEEPVLSLLAAEDEEDEQLGEEGNWLESVQSLVPFVLNRFEVENGTITFDFADDAAPLMVKANSLQMLATDITNVADVAEELPSRLRATATLEEGAPLRLEGRFDLTGDTWEMDMELECEPIELDYLNPFLEKYANLDVRGGNLGLFAECAVAAGEVDGYLKFLAQDIDVYESGEEGGPLSALWEAVAAGLITITKNRNKDQFAAKVPFSGKTEDFSAGTFASVGSLLRNAFVKALSGNVDDSISLADLDQEN